MKNAKQSSKTIASQASKVLKDNSSSKIAKQFAGSIMSQSNTKKETGAAMETKASNAMKSDKYNDLTKSMAASLLSQSNTKR